MSTVRKEKPKEKNGSAKFWVLRLLRKPLLTKEVWASFCDE
jgi:hypothetical protein